MYSDILKHKLKEMRELKGYTQESIAKELKVSQGTYSSWETGRKTPEIKTLLRIADYYEIELDYLFGRDLEMNRKIKNK